MSALQLFIGNRNYSPWSMRPWVLMQGFDLPFEEVFVRLDADLPAVLAEKGGRDAHSPSKVPVLRDGDLVVWDSLAIAEYVAERFPEKQLWPKDAAQRAHARSLCAEMHSGFVDLRSNCNMNISAVLHEVGQKIYAENASVRADVARLNEIFSLAAENKGPYLFGEFSTADAYFAPVVLRMHTYGLPFSEAAEPYRRSILAHPAVAQWVAAAKGEQDFLLAHEPYRHAH